jgi:hypothetical protein
MVKHFIILFLIPLFSIAQIVDMSEDISDGAYSFKLPKKDYSHLDFTLTIQYFFSNTFSAFSNIYEQHELLDFYLLGDCHFREAKKKRPNLSHKEIVIRRYSAYKISNFEIGQISILEESFQNTFLKSLIENLRLKNTASIQLDFVQKEDYVVVPNTYLERNFTFSPIKYAFYSSFMNLTTTNLIKKYKPQIDAVLFKTETDYVEVFPIFLLYERDGPDLLFVDLYFSQHNKELRNDSFTLHLNDANIYESANLLKILEIAFNKTYQRINSNEAFILN